MPALAPNILYYDSLPSTNTEAGHQAEQGAAEGTTIVAGEQTAGRGRLERRWISPAGGGIYASVILRPQFNMALWSLIPLMAALAVREALQVCCALNVDIKWPNDILVGNRKLCGILSETVETSEGRAVIIGIGINLTGSGVPEDLRAVATSLEDETQQKIDAKTILQAVLNALSEHYLALQVEGGERAIIKRWEKSSSYAKDKRVSIHAADETFTGITRGLEPDGALRVETDSGQIKIVRAGDVQNVRLRLAGEM